MDATLVFDAIIWMARLLVRGEQDLLPRTLLTTHKYRIENHNYKIVRL